MYGSSRLARAIAIAVEAHRDQTSKNGGPFIEHVGRVADGVTTEEEKMVAWLHDVVEKGPGWSLARLREEGFPEPVVDAVDALTRREEEEYLAFASRSVRNPLARTVKRADLADNLAQMRQIGGDGSKYIEALSLIDGKHA